MELRGRLDQNLECTTLELPSGRVTFLTQKQGNEVPSLLISAL
uniref:Uncharacterized protein n=1 Tax=Arundo donax TaxID=35708 RepID=A0A0A9TJR4_ARUDO